MTIEVSSENIHHLQTQLCDASLPMAQRHRCIFTLRNIGGKEAIDALVAAFADRSALLKHEIAYVLGQMGDKYSFPVLKRLLEDTTEDFMVRHEAAEAMAAIGEADALPVLQKYLDDPCKEVAETCQIAVARILWERDNGRHAEGQYGSIDPAPATKKSIEELRKIYNDQALPHFERYGAMFGLRDLGTEEAVKVIVEGFEDPSALYRHEVAYVLGQMQHPAAAQALAKVLQDDKENPMVRHEAAEALGAIADESSIPILKEFASDPADVVRESCEVATDIHDYYSSDQFQYADGLAKQQ